MLQRHPVLFGALLSLLASGPFPSARAQPTSEQLAARCSQLYALADRYLTRRGEGSGGPNMILLGAGLDCQKGRYEQGVATLEELLRGQRVTIPPPPG